MNIAAWLKVLEARDGHARLWRHWGLHELLHGDEHRRELEVVNRIEHCEEHTWRRYAFDSQPVREMGLERVVLDCHGAHHDQETNQPAIEAADIAKRTSRD